MRPQMAPLGTPWLFWIWEEHRFFVWLALAPLALVALSLYALVVLVSCPYFVNNTFYSWPGTQESCDSNRVWQLLWCVPYLPDNRQQRQQHPLASTLRQFLHNHLNRHSNLQLFMRRGSCLFNIQRHGKNLATTIWTHPLMIDDTKKHRAYANYNTNHR